LKTVKIKRKISFGCSLVTKSDAWRESVHLHHEDITGNFSFKK
jgi:hypothetical protein